MNQYFDVFLVIADIFNSASLFQDQKKKSVEYKITSPIKVNGEDVVNRIQKQMKEVSGTFRKQADGESSVITMRDNIDTWLFIYVQLKREQCHQIWVSLLDIKLPLFGISNLLHALSWVNHEQSALNEFLVQQEIQTNRQPNKYCVKGLVQNAMVPCQNT